MTIPDSVRPRRPRRATLAAAAAWLTALLLAGFVAMALHSVQDSNRGLQDSNRRLADGQSAQATVIARLSTSLDTTRQQLQQHGVTPSAPPAESIVGGVPGVPGNPGAAGARGTPGAVGPSGPPGSPGPTGPTGKTGSTGPSGTPGISVTGPAGTDGQGGAQGDPGPAGPQGDPGPAGPAGTDGRDGAAGQPPAGWTYTWTDSTGATHQVTCARTADSPDSNPQYDCADATPAPTPSGPAAPSGILGLGMLAATATYRRL